MAFEWKDKRDGVDDILADDINGMAHAIMENEKNIPREPAGVYKTDISLLDLENETNEENVVIKAKSVDLGTNGTAKFYVSGHIRFTTKGVWGIHTPMVKVDGKIINSNEVGTDEDGYVLYAYEFDGDIAESIELITSGSYTYVEFETLCKIEEKNGLMTGKQAEKLDSTEIFTAKEKTKLENTPTKEEVNNLIAESTGEALEGDY